MRHEIKLRHGGLMVIEGDRDLPEAAVVHRTFNGKLKNMSEDKDGASICEADYISEILRLAEENEELQKKVMLLDLETAALRGMLDQKAVDGKTVITTTITFQRR